MEPPTPGLRYQQQHSTVTIATPHLGQRVTGWDGRAGMVVALTQPVEHRIIGGSVWVTALNPAVEIEWADGDKTSMRGWEFGEWVADA